MTSREFLNVAHAALVEEFMRPRLIRGTTIPGMALDEALDQASLWAEGFTQVPLAVTDGQETRTVAAARQKTEEEMVAQNEQAMQHLMAQMSNMKGGFGLKPATAT